MIAIQLFIEGQEIELFEDESVTLNQSIQEVRDISKLFTDFTQTFNVPASKLNNKAFKHFYNYHINGFDARTKKESQLFLNYKPFKNGKIKLEGVSLKDNKAQSYKITFFGNTVKLADQLGDATLNNLDLLTKHFTFEYSDTNILNLMSDAQDITSGFETYEDALLVPLITHTDRLFYDTSANDAGTGNLAHSSASEIHGVNYLQLKPAIRVYAVIKAIEHQYFKPKGIIISDDFFSKTNLPFYNLYLWLHSRAGGLIETNDAMAVMLKDFQLTNTKSQGHRKMGKVKGSSLETYTSGKSKKISITITPADLTVEYDFIIKKDGEEYFRSKGLSGENSDIKDLTLGKGASEFTFFVESKSALGFSVAFNAHKPYGYKNRRRIEWTGTATVLSNQQVSAGEHMPKMKIIDFLTGLFKMFNLTAYIDLDNVLQIKTLDQYYSDSENYYDITKYIDKNTSQVDSVIPFKQVNFSFEGKENFFAKDHEQRFKKGWGDLKYSSSDADGGTYEIKVPFEHMKYERLIDQNSSLSAPLNRTQIQWGWGADINKNSHLGKPLLFYPQLRNTTVCVINASNTKVAKYGVYCPSNSLYTLSTYNSGGTLKDANSENINFNAEFNEFLFEYAFQKTLFNEYYKNYIEDVFRQDRRLTKVKAKLPMKFLYKLALNDKLIIRDGVYKINKISTNFESEFSNLELINVVDERPVIEDLTESIGSIDNAFSTVSIDSTLLTIDATADFRGFQIAPIITKVPTAIASNKPAPKANDPCQVTAPVIALPTQEVNTSTSVKFKYTVSVTGKICDAYILESVGFLFADSEATLLSSDDVDTLIGTTGVTNRNFLKTEAGTISTEISGLTNPATKYWRFYARTNTKPSFDKADAISNVFASSTFVSISYTTTTNPTKYQLTDFIPGATVGNIRTIRIKDNSDNLVDYKGIGGYATILSKIVPYVVEGLPYTFTANGTASNTGIYGYSTQTGVFYHATSRTEAQELAKRDNTLATDGSVKKVAFTNYVTGTEYSSSSSDGNFPLRREGYALYTTTSDYVFLDTYQPDGFYAMWRISGNGVWAWKVSRDRNSIEWNQGISAELVGGIVKNIQRFT
tara:strand:+ start:2654 stop:5932 length:3279 start_codon:yes stop_codon:yes gene_type:complete